MIILQWLMSRATTCPVILVDRAINHTIAMQCACIKTVTHTEVIVVDGVGHVGAINLESEKVLTTFQCK